MACVAAGLWPAPVERSRQIRFGEHVTFVLPESLLCVSLVRQPD